MHRWSLSKQVLALSLALLLSPGAQAQSLGKLLRDAFGPSGRACKPWVEWVRSPAPAAANEGAPPQRGYAPGLDAQTQHLLSDAVFERSFGKRYEALSLQDFRQFQQEVMPACMKGGELTPAEWQTVQTLWNQHQHARLVQMLQAQRARQQQQEREAATARAELESLRAELRQATPQNSSLARLQALRDRGRALAPRVGASEAQGFETEFQQQAQALVPTLLRQRVDEALAQAQAPEHLPLLLRAREAVAARGNPLGIGLPEDDASLLSLQRRERELATSAAAAERRELAGFADGLPGLEAGVEWQRRFQARWGGINAPELAAVQTDFRQRREAVLAGMGPLLRRAAEQSASIAEAQALPTRYTLPSEAQLPAVQALRAAVDERLRLIERNNALGRPTPPGPAVALAPAPGPTPLPAAQRPTPAAPPAAAGEPSEEVMYDLVRQKFENAAQRMKGLYDQCKGGGSRGNPMNAMICLGLNLQSGATGGAAAQPTRILRFAKIGCEKSPSRPGYNCEYEIQTDSALNKQFSQMLGFELDEAGFGQARFVRNREGLWLMITGDRS